MIRIQLSVYNTYLLNLQAFQVTRAALTNLTRKRSDILHNSTRGLFQLHLTLKIKKTIDSSFWGKAHPLHYQNACFPEEDKLQDICFLIISPQTKLTWPLVFYFYGNVDKGKKWDFLNLVLMASSSIHAVLGHCFTLPWLCLFHLQSSILHLVWGRELYHG